LLVIVWAFRPGSTKAYEDTQQIPFRNEDKPASEAAAGTEEAL
jgi:cytochrome c oxidase cbb3-type subunit 4